MAGLTKSKVALVVGVLVLGMLLAMPSSGINSNDNNASTMANGSRTFSIGIVDYAYNVATLNPFLYTTTQEFQTIMPCYSTLLTYDIDGNLIGDLANSWSVSADGTTWNFKLATNAYFCDPSNPTSMTHQVTGDDVIWTFWMVNNDSDLLLNYYFVHDGSVIQSMWKGTDSFDVYVKTAAPYAPFLSAAANIPIVPKYIWGTVDPAIYANNPPIGSGPFYYGLSGLPTTVGILKRNPIWFQEVNHGWQIHVDTLQLKTELSPVTAWAELTASPPVIDVFQGVTSSQYISYILKGTTPWISGFAVSTGHEYEYQLNQLTPLMRAQLVKAGKIANGGSNNPLLSDPTVKLALAMCVDKQSFVDQVLGGLGNVADSMIPDISSWHYAYPNPVQFSPTKAREILNGAGWQWDALGNPATTTTVPLYKKGGANNTVYHPLSFRLVSIAGGAEWDVGSRLLQEWASQAGVMFTRTLVSYNQMNSIWYHGDYDAWLWDWQFSPMIDPSVDCMSIDTTMEIGRFSGSFWSNSVYDDLYNQSLVTVDHDARKSVTDQLQSMVYEDHNHQTVTYAKSLYAINYRTWDKDSFGNWETNWPLIPDLALPWLYTRIAPVDNLAPTVSVLPTWNGVKDTPISFYGSATDTSVLEYQWYWGDGSTSGWLPLSATGHTYQEGGTYTAYLAAKEVNTADAFSTWAKAIVAVTDTDNTPPHSLAIVRQPTNPSAGAPVTFAGSAVDDNNDPLTYSWTFGDGGTSNGQTVQHTYAAPGTYTVTMEVTDSQPGLGRPVWLAVVVPVGPANSPPSVSVPSALVQWKSTSTFTINAYDADNDALKITWLWGDGAVSVTYSLTAEHYYKQKGVYTLTVIVDDLTGLPGHTVTASGLVTVKDLTKPRPH